MSSITNVNPHNNIMYALIKGLCERSEVIRTIYFKMHFVISIALIVNLKSMKKMQNFN